MRRLRCNKCDAVLKLGMNFSHAKLIKSIFMCTTCTKEACRIWYLKRRHYRIKKAKEWANLNRSKSNSIKRAYANTPKGRVARRKARAVRLERIRLATPQWLSSEHRVAIRGIYRLANKLSRESGVEWHVDHIVPLAGKLVCGLHVPWNLQVVPASVNLNKGVGI